MSKNLKIDSEVADFIIKALSFESGGLTDEQVVEELADTVCPSFPNGEYKKKLLYRFLYDFRRAQEEYVHFDDVRITRKEFEWLAKVKKIKTRKQLFCLIVWKKLHNHPSGWIRLDKEEIFSLLFTPNEIRQMNLDPYGYTDCFGGYSELRVIGSKNPIVCYRLPEEIESQSEVWISFNPDNEKDICWIRDLFNYDWSSGEVIKTVRR